MAYFIQTINGYLWGFPMIAFLFCTHLFMSIKTGFVQRKVIKGIRLCVKSSEKGKGEMSSFSCLATSLASTLGTGNIIGVGTAVAMGGAGAVFWCWVTGIFGMATQYCECMLSVKYRVRNEKGEYSGGPMYVLEHGAGSRKIAIVYAFLAAVCGLITGAAIQSNSISGILCETIKAYNTGAPQGVYVFVSLTVGVVAALLAGIVIFGGVKSIGKVCSYLVPFMAVAYIGGCVAVLYINRSFLLCSVSLIIREAFSLRSVGGGVSGSVMMLSCRYGMARGLFSNEAGLGTSSVVSACANTTHPVRQGLVSMTATFWDTVVMCLVTGVMIVSTIQAKPGFANYDGGVLCLEAFRCIPYIGEFLLVFSMVTFAFSTILGWFVVGEKCARYVFGKGAFWYAGAWVLCVLLAPVISLSAVWELGDLANGLLVIPNVTALILLSNNTGKETKEYLRKNQKLP